MGFGRARLYFWDELPGRLPLLGKRFRAMAVRVAKKSARAISSLQHDDLVKHINPHNYLG